MATPLATTTTSKTSTMNSRRSDILGGLVCTKLDSPFLECVINEWSSQKRSFTINNTGATPQNNRSIIPFDLMTHQRIRVNARCCCSFTPAALPMTELEEGSGESSIVGSSECHHACAHGHV